MNTPPVKVLRAAGVAVRCSGGSLQTKPAFQALPPELRTLVRERRAELLEWLRDEHRAATLAWLHEAVPFLGSAMPRSADGMHRVFLGWLEWAPSCVPPVGPLALTDFAVALRAVAPELLDADDQTPEIHGAPLPVPNVSKRVETLQAQAPPAESERAA